MYYTRETKISPLTQIRRERILPRRGEVLVSPGDRVEATQIVARASLPGDFRIVAVARLLGVSAAEAEDRLQISLGDTVHRGDVIAKRRGPLGRPVRAPIDGIMTAMGGGRVLIEAQPVPFELHAHIPGTVLNVKSNQYISIETVGALVQCAWGWGEESVGVLKSMAERPSDALQARAVDPSCHGSILFTGTLLDQEPLARARDIEVRGIVTGGILPALIATVEELPFPVIVTEGFGDLPMMKKTFDLFKKHEGLEISISGAAEIQGALRRAEIIMAMPGKKPPAENIEQKSELRQGTQVRVVRSPHLGSVGTVVEIPEYARRIATGARAYCAEVDIGQDEPVFVPLVNLEILR